MNLLASFARIRLIALDVDGVLTNGQLLLLDDGQMARSMSIRDGYALQLAVRRGYHILVISGGSSEAVRIRLNRLGIHEVRLAVKDKSTVLSEYMHKAGIRKEETLYMGDDMPDYSVMQMAGLPCCPADAAPEIRALSLYISPKNGGDGCVRDVLEKILKLNGHWDENPDVQAI